MIETLFNLSLYRQKAHLRQDNPSLKHFGSAPVLEHNESEHVEPSLFFILRKNRKYGRLMIFMSVNEGAQCKKRHVGSLKEFKSY